MTGTIDWTRLAGMLHDQIAADPSPGDETPLEQARWFLALSAAKSHLEGDSFRDTGHLFLHGVEPIPEIPDLAALAKALEDVFGHEDDQETAEDIVLGEADEFGWSR